MLDHCSLSQRSSSSVYTTISLRGCTKNHPLVFSSSKIMFTWHICYTSNSASSQFTVQPMITFKIRRPIPRYYRNKSPRSHGITVNLDPVPVVLPWSWSPSPQCYRELCPHCRGVTVVTAGKPWSPSPCSSLLRSSRRETGSWLYDTIRYEMLF